jgi:hypothetical protein
MFMPVPNATSPSLQKQCRLRLIFLTGTTPNNGMHPTADTLLVKFLQWPGAAGDAWRYVAFCSGWSEWGANPIDTVESGLLTIKRERSIINSTTNVPLMEIVTSSPSSFLSLRMLS